MTHCEQCGMVIPTSYTHHCGIVPHNTPHTDCPIEGGERKDAPDFGAALKASNPKDAAATDRLDLSLFPSSARIYGALAMMEGHLKYGAYNWREIGVLASVYTAALERHMLKWIDGEDCDPATNVPHLANALACIAILIDAREAGKLVDDRPPRAETAALLEVMRAKVKALQASFPNGPGRYTASGADARSGQSTTIRSRNDD